MNEERISLKPLWKRWGKKAGEFAVVAITLTFTYFFLAFWGVIVLIMAGFEKAGAVLKEAESNTI